MADVLVCKDGEIAEGGVRVIQAGEVEIGVIRHDGKYYAYRNHCPHQGGPVCEGIRMPGVLDIIGEGGIFLQQDFDQKDIHIVCPWHSYEFHLEDGVNVCDKRIRLQKFKVVEKDGAVYINV